MKGKPQSSTILTRAGAIIITDSWDIAMYLNNTYPEKPVFPKDTNGLIHAFDAVYTDQIRPAIKFHLCVQRRS